MQYFSIMKNDGGKTGAEKISGSVERVVYYNEENGYSVIKLKTGKGGVLDAVGSLGRRTPGERLLLSGKWEMKEGWGFRFVVDSFTVAEPDSLESLKKYLASDLIEGIGPKFAARLVSHFGENLLEIIREHPERLLEVEGIGKKKAESICKAITAEDREAQIIRELSIRLLGEGIGPAKVRKIYSKYKGAALDILSRDPFRLADEMEGIGFQIADKIAKKMNTPKDSPSRIRAGVLYTLKKATEDGHCFVPSYALADNASSLLGLDRAPIAKSIEVLALSGKLIADQDRVYPPSLYRAEIQSAEALALLARNPSRSLPREEVEKRLEAFERERGIVFTREQRAAVESGLCENCVSVITGGPGTGKTTVIEAIVSLARKASFQPLLCAPTGRAANRLSQTTDHEAFTIHRLLEWTPGQGFKYGQGRTLDTGMLILDEASMVDIELLSSLLTALKPGTRVIVVGDADQLPSVGPGQVLSDIISSGKVPVVRLESIHRQAEKSRIIHESYNIINGRMPDLRNDPSGDFFFIHEEDREAGLKTIVDLVSRRLPKTYGLDPIRDIQVIVPMYKGICGANALNESLRRELNFADKRSDSRFFQGDKVMQTRNNYDLNVFNGDIGFVESITKDSLTVDFNRLVTYDRDSAEDIVLAYAITAHKSQGGEVPCVVMPVYKEHFILLNRNLLYTAITRAKRLCVLVGQPSALSIAIGRSESSHRCTALDSRIRLSFEQGNKFALKPSE